MLALSLSVGVCAPLQIAQAASEEGQFAVKGVGRDQCSQFLDARSQSRSAYEDYGHFIAGYLTASNRLMEDTVDVTTWESIEVVAAYVANLCRQKPSARFAEAIEGVLATLMPSRVTQDARLIKVTVDEKSIRVYASVLARVGKALAERDLFRGSVDGRFSTELEQALRRFQAQSGLSETGLPDQRTLYLLLRPGGEFQ